MQMSPSAPLLPLPPQRPQVRPGAITKKREGVEEGGGCGVRKTVLNPPPPTFSLSLKGTDQMASELLNVQQPLVSPDASLLHNTGPIYVPTNSLTSAHRSVQTFIYAAASPRVASDIWGYSKAYAWPVPCATCRPASRPNCVTTTICSATFLWRYPCRGFHMFTPPPKQVDLFVLPHIYFLATPQTPPLHINDVYCFSDVCVKSFGTLIKYNNFYFILLANNKVSDSINVPTLYFEPH